MRGFVSAALVALASCSGALQPIGGSGSDAAADAPPADSVASCSGAPDGTPCATQDHCVAEARCVAGACAATAYLDCDDSDPCTLDGCDPQQGCVHAPGSAC